MARAVQCPDCRHWFTSTIDRAAHHKGSEPGCTVPEFLPQFERNDQGFYYVAHTLPKQPPQSRAEALRRASQAGRDLSTIRRSPLADQLSAIRPTHSLGHDYPDPS